MTRVRIDGGADTIQQYLRERLIDELHIAISPVLLGAGERLFEGVDLVALRYACTKPRRWRLILCCPGSDRSDPLDSEHR